MVTIPSGARSIHICELNVSASYISVRNDLQQYYLNGHWTVDWPGRYKFSGTTFNYRRPSNEPESLTSVGPTNETLIVEVEAFLTMGFQKSLLTEPKEKLSVPHDQVSEQKLWSLVLLRALSCDSCVAQPE